MVDLFEKYIQGQQAGQAKRRQRTLSENYLGAVQGDQNALAQVYGVDPEAGMQAQTFRQRQQRAQRQEADDDIIRASQFYLQTKSPQAWSYIHQKFRADPRFQGMPATIESPEDQEGSLQFANALVNSMGGAGDGLRVHSRFIDDQDNMVALLSDSTTRVVGKANPNIQILEGEGGFYGVNKGTLNATPVQLGGPQATQGPPHPMASNGASYTPDDATIAGLEAEIGSPLSQEERMQVANGTFRMQIPVGGAAPPPAMQSPMGQLRPKQQQISPAEAMRLQMERERIEMQRQEAEERRKANAVTGKPPTEGERKAATLLQRLDFSLNQLQTAVKESPSAVSPKVATETLRRLPLIGEVAANAATPAERQRVESAQLDILDAALTLGTGAAYTREQLEGYRRAYFPQIGDAPAAIRDKAARLDNVINAARIAAGRAAAEVQPAARPAQQRTQPAPSGGWKIQRIP